MAAMSLDFLAAAALSGLAGTLAFLNLVILDEGNSASGGRY